MKLRPVLLLTGPIGQGPEVLVAYISSVIPSLLLDSDVILDPNATDGRGTKLKAVSVLRLHKLATIHVCVLARRLGRVSPSMQAVVAEKLQALLNL